MGCKVSYPLGGIRVEAMGNDAKEVFENLASICDVFSYGQKCGKCGCENISPVVRHPQNYTYYEFRCMNPDCGAKFSFGQMREDGSLFPKNRDQNGNALPDGGWEIYQPQQNQNQNQNRQQQNRGNGNQNQGRQQQQCRQQQQQGNDFNNGFNNGDQGDIPW